MRSMCTSPTSQTGAPGRSSTRRGRRTTTSDGFRHVFTIAMHQKSQLQCSLLSASSPNTPGEKRGTLRSRELDVRWTLVHVAGLAMITCVLDGADPLFAGIQTAGADRLRQRAGAPGLRAHATARLRPLRLLVSHQSGGAAALRHYHLMHPHSHLQEG